MSRAAYRASRRRRLEGQVLRWAGLTSCLYGAILHCGGRMHAKYWLILSILFFFDVAVL